MADTVLEGLPKYFEPIRQLGEGGMGVVWSVRDTRINKIGALKVIRRKPDMTPITITRFEREIRNFAQLVHPYIVQVYDVGQMETGEPYIFMEQINGQPISAELLKGRPFSEIVLLIDRILEGLNEAHANNLIHRDLKPDNILISEDSEGHLMPNLMDFGLALRADENEMRITSDGMVVGTPIYMAPEQACDEHYQICPATDFYGIGCILYELFCGAPPFTGSNAVMVMVAQAKEKPKPFQPLPEFSETIRLSSIINRLLEKMPDRRYETVADFRAALRRQFLIRDNQAFGTMALKSRDSDTVFDERKDENTPFFSSELAPKTYKTILPDIGHCNYNYSVLSLRPPMFVGRSSAKYLLNRYLKDVFQCRRTALTMITGRPGVGKSRFLESFCQDCYKQGTAASLVINGSVSDNLKFAVYCAFFAKLLLKTLVPEQVTLALCRFMQTEDECDNRVKALEAIFNAEVNRTPPPVDKMDLVFCDVLAKLTRTRPLVLCFDNVSQKQRLELTKIAKEITGLPQIKLPIMICVVNTTIDDMPTDIELTLGNESSIWLRRSIAINPLSNSDMHTLITQSLSVSQELAGFISNLSSGLPQIAVSLARQWQLAGLLEPTENGYISKQPIESLPIPRGVHEAILQQLVMTFAEYPHRAWQPIAAIAACYGDTFTPRKLADAISYIPAKNRCINHSTFISLALSSGVLKTIDDSTLAFSNPLMREALMASLQAYELQDYHHAIAMALQAAGNREHDIGTDREIAMHLKAASQFGEAYRVFLSMAKRSKQCGELTEALKYIEEAKDAIRQHLDVVDARSPEMASIWLIETDIYIEKHDAVLAGRQIKWLEYACQYQQEPSQDAAFYVLKSKLAQLNGEDKDALVFLDKALGILASLPVPLTREQLETKFYAYVLRFQYDPSIGQAFIDTARELKDAIFVGKALLALAGHSLEMKDYPRAKRILNMTVDTAHKNGDLLTEANALHMLSKIESDAVEVRIKTLYDASEVCERLGEFGELSQIHCELAELLRGIQPDEARIHEQWGAVLGNR